jgi:hypothetical protein
MEFIPFIVLVVLFVLLTPGVLLRIPPGGGKLTVAIVHAILFAVIYRFLPIDMYFVDDDSDSFKARGCAEWGTTGLGKRYCKRY